MPENRAAQVKTSSAHNNVASLADHAHQEELGSSPVMVVTQGLSHWTVMVKLKLRVTGILLTIFCLQNSKLGNEMSMAGEKKRRPGTEQMGEGLGGYYPVRRIVLLSSSRV